MSVPSWHISSSPEWPNDLHDYVCRIPVRNPVRIPVFLLRTLLFLKEKKYKFPVSWPLHSHLTCSEDLKIFWNLKPVQLSLPIQEYSLKYFSVFLEEHRYISQASFNWLLILWNLFTKSMAFIKVMSHHHSGKSLFLLLVLTDSLLWRQNIEWGTGSWEFPSIDTLFV